MEKDKVNSPEHYKTCIGIEVWEMMLKAYGKEAFINFCLINAFKYRMRAGKKGDIETDIKKAQWYENKVKEIQSAL